jgi:ABC-type transport system involved in multi-copper enzyme maturation permease subunit
MFRALAWVHPVPLAITWAHAIVCCTRIPAGEVDRGTIDVLLGLPVSRWSVHTSDTLVWLAGSVWFFIAGIAGTLCGGSLAGAPITLPRTVVAATNLLALYLAVGGIARLFSAWSDRRGRAVGVAFLFVAASFLFNYLTQFWPAIERLGFLSLLHYHRPITVFRRGAVPLGDIGVLLAVAITAWVAAGWSFARRDLTTT